MLAKSPNGRRIIGTLEAIVGVALIGENAFTRSKSGEIQFDYQGETKINWDDQKTVTRPVRENGKTVHKRVYVDEDGTTYTEDQIILADQ